jgi:hypothetical protein
MIEKEIFHAKTLVEKEGNLGLVFMKDDLIYEEQVLTYLNEILDTSNSPMFVRLWLDYKINLLKEFKKKV